MRNEGKIILPLMALAVLCAAPGCTSQTVSGKPLAELTFDAVQPLYVSATNIDVIDNYSPSADPQDVSSQMPTPPDIAVRRWAERRLQPGPGTGTLRFTIESASVHATHYGPETTLQRWTGQGAHKRYEVLLKISVAKETDSAMGRNSHAMSVTRSVTIPDSYSIAKREAELQTFMETLVADVDKAVTEVLQADGLLAAAPSYANGMAPAPMAPAPVLPAPEMGTEQNQNGENFQSPYNH